jgi:hypothetical protein
MTLPTTFKKIKGHSGSIDPSKDATGGGGEGKGGPGRNRQRKRKLNQKLAGSAVRNDKQLKEFKMVDGETW